MRWRRRASIHPLTCQEVVELVSDYLEGLLDADTARRLEQHLTGCDPCVSYVGQIRTTVALAGQVPPDQLDPDTERTLVELYRTWQAHPDDGAGG